MDRRITQGTVVFVPCHLDLPGKTCCFPHEQENKRAFTFKYAHESTWYVLLPPKSSSEYQYQSSGLKSMTRQSFKKERGNSPP